jgi:putative Mg2+ transporter-C (MgtC) family protein
MDWKVFLLRVGAALLLGALIGAAQATTALERLVSRISLEKGVSTVRWQWLALPLAAH